VTNFDTRRASEPVSVEMSSVAVRFGELLALKSVDLTVRPGELFTLLGPSGCGKTTLLRSIAGFNCLAEGHIRFNGRNVDQLQPWNRNIGFVFQNYALWPTKTIFENVAYGLRMRKVPRDEIVRRVAGVLDLVELGEVASQYPGQLSGGMQQRAALARAVVIDPPLLLLDEPLSNLDAKLRVTLRRGIREMLVRLGLTAIYVTHDQEEALDISDRIAVMNRGRVAQVGTPREIYDQPDSSFVADFVGKANFIEGRVVGKSFVTRTGTRLDVPLRLACEASNVRCAFIRPEDIEIRSDARSQLRGTVEGTSYFGSFFQHRIALEGGQKLFVQTRTHLDLGRVTGMQIPHLTGYPELPPSQD